MTECSKPHLLDLQADFRDQLDDGVRCPLCLKYGKRYKRKFNSTMARGLIWLVDQSSLRCDWVYVPSAPRLILNSNQISTTAYWNLIERKKNVDPKKKSSGYWRPKHRAYDFVFLRTTISRYVWEYNGKVESFSAEQIDIKQALDDVFDYSALIQGVCAWPA